MRRDIDAVVAALAAGQRGVFADRQAEDCGADRKLIARRIAAGLWLRVAPGVLGLPGHPPSFVRSLWIALLAAPPRTVVSHWSAAALHGMTGYPRNRFHITVPRGTHLLNPVAVVHQTSAMPEVVWLQGLPVTTIERTVVDLGKVSSPGRLGPAVEDLVLDGRSTLEKMRREFLRLARQGRNGVTVVRQVLDDRDGSSTPSRPRLEAALDRILDALPGAPPRHEAPLPGWEWTQARVDRRYDEERLIVEGDGRRWHARTADFTRDRQRDRQAMLAGYRVARYAYGELIDDPDGVRAELLALLGR